MIQERNLETATLQLLENKISLIIKDQTKINLKKYTFEGKDYYLKSNMEDDMDLLTKRITNLIIEYLKVKVLDFNKLQNSIQNYSGWDRQISFMEEDIDGYVNNMLTGLI